jgi:hypothetical protein
MTNFWMRGGAFVALCALIGSQQAGADVVYSTNFNAPLYADGPLIGQDSWAITGSSVVNPINVANAATNGNVTLTTTGQDANRTFTPISAASLLSIEYSVEINVASAQTGDYFIHLGDGGSSNFYNRLWARASANNGFFQLGMATSSGTTINYGADLPLGVVLNIVSRYDIVAGLANDTGQVFVNGNPYIAATTLGIDATTFGSVNLRQGTASAAPTVTVDNIVVSTTPIPEPSSTILLSLAIVGLAGCRRK